MEGSAESELILGMIRDDLFDHGPRCFVDKKPPKGWVKLTVPAYGTWYFAPGKQPSKDTLERWRQMYEEVQELRAEAERTKYGEGWWSEKKQEENPTSEDAAFANIYIDGAPIASVLYTEEASGVAVAACQAIQELIPDAEMEIEVKPANLLGG